MRKNKKGGISPFGGTSLSPMSSRFIFIGAFTVITLIFILSATFNPALDQLEGLNEEHTGSRVLKLMGIIFVVGVLLMVYRGVISPMMGGT